MQDEEYEVVISGLCAGEAESLRRDLTGAAVRTRPGTDPGGVVIRSRANAIFSAEDVLEVLADWIEKKPDRLETASVAVHRVPRRAPVLPGLLDTRGQVRAPAPIGSRRRRIARRQSL